MAQHCKSTTLQFSLKKCFLNHKYSTVSPKRTLSKQISKQKKVSAQRKLLERVVDSYSPQCKSKYWNIGNSLKFQQIGKIQWKIRRPLLFQLKVSQTPVMLVIPMLENLKFMVKFKYKRPTLRFPQTPPQSCFSEPLQAHTLALAAVFLEHEMLRNICHEWSPCANKLWSLY